MSFIRQDNKSIDVVLLIFSFIAIVSYTLFRLIDEGASMVWSFFPVTILGVVFLYENLYTLNSRKSYFSALSIFLAFGFSFFYIVPFNQLIWDYWPSIPVADGMSGWVGGWAILCLLGFFITAIGCKSTKVNFRRPLNYHIDTNKMHMPFIVGIVFCLICQIVVLVKMGGYDGYLNAYELRLEDSIQNYNPYDGFGFLFTFSESLPNLVAIYLVLFIKDKSWSRDVKVLVSLLVFLFLLNMLFGGLRGSRSTTVWSLFWFVVVYHNNVKELSLKLLVALGAIFFLFMTSYSLYKFGGIEGLQGLWDKDIKAQVFEQKYIEDSEKFALVRDAGRADVQSYILKTYWNDEYPLSYGRTLVAGAVSFVPGFLLPNKPVTAIKEKTGIFWSDYSFTDSSYTTLLAGGYGEFVINFGIFFGLTFFYIFGVVISWIDGYSKVFPKDGVYNLIVPVLVLLSIQLLMSDSNVVSQFLFRFLTVPLIVLLCCPKIVKSNN